jgi:hypothetical protein
MKIRYCCDTMQGYIGSRGNRGISVAVTIAPAFFGSHLVFVLEVRPVSLPDLHAAKIPAECTVLTETKVCIKFCPWCGARLAKHYTRFRADLPILPDLLKDFGVST